MTSHARSPSHCMTSLSVRGCLAPSSVSEAAWLRPQCRMLPDFHGNPLEFLKYFYPMTFPDPSRVSVSNFIRIGPETAKEIENKGKKCPNLPASVLSCFIVWLLVQSVSSVRGLIFFREKKSLCNIGDQSIGPVAGRRSSHALFGNQQPDYIRTPRWPPKLTCVIPDGRAWHHPR